VRIEQLIEEYQQPISRLCRVYARDADAAQDLFQEVLLALFQGLPNFRGDCSLRTWVYRVAHNVGITFAVRTRREKGRAASLADVGNRPSPANRCETKLCCTRRSGSCRYPISK
jgi:RNA polymerase sigma-70 factor (ECF subfamily)